MARPATRSTVKVEVENLDQIAKRLDAPQLVGPPLRHLMKTTLEDKRRVLIQNTPVYTGRLKAGWGRVNIAPDPLPLKGGVANDVFYGRFVNAGTHPPFKAGYPPSSSRSSYSGNLGKWAQAKGIPFFILQRAIHRRGIRAQPILKKSVRDSRSELLARTERMADDIEQSWQT